MKVQVSVVQDSPVFFNKQKTIDKINKITVEEASNGSRLIVFPESFLPGYPRGFTFGTKVGSRSQEGRDLYNIYYENSIDIQSSDIQHLNEISKKTNAYMIVGVTEKNATNGSLFCSMLYISPIAGLMGVHRKIKPTGQERVIWAEADGGSLIACRTQIGRLGGLICWENYMPLARMSMYQQGVEIYVAPTADSRPTWTTTMIQIALEGRCFVLGCNQYFTRSMYPEKYQHLLTDHVEDICPGGSLIVSPSGEVISGPLFDEPGVLRAQLDMDDIVKRKLDFDPIGHYSRNDIFNFSVNNQPEIIDEIKPDHSH